MLKNSILQPNICSIKECFCVLSVVVSMEVNTKHYFWSNFIYTSVPRNTTLSCEYHWVHPPINWFCEVKRIISIGHNSSVSPLTSKGNDSATLADGYSAELHAALRCCATSLNCLQEFTALCKMSCSVISTPRTRLPHQIPTNCSLTISQSCFSGPNSKKIAWQASVGNGTERIWALVTLTSLWAAISKTNCCRRKSQ